MASSSSDEASEPPSPTAVISRWNTEANYPSLSNSDYGNVMSVLNLVVRWWRKVRGIEVRDGTPVERPAARQPPAPSE